MNGSDMENEFLYIDQYGLRGTNFYWHKYEVKGLSKEDILAAGLTSDRVQVHRDLIQPLLAVQEALQERRYILFLKEGYRESAIPRVAGMVDWPHAREWLPPWHQAGILPLRLSTR